jgi:diaminopimelate epimerase
MNFWKMHGLGNDYVVIDNQDGKVADAETAGLAKRLCDRRFGVGADGLLLVCQAEATDARMRIFNSDGSEAEMCGNGIRCFAKYCYENGIAPKTEFSVETLAGVKHVWLTVQNGVVASVKVDMGAPRWERKALPMAGEGTCIDQDLQAGGETFKVTCLSMGNPHCVIFVEDVAQFPVERVGPLIENHKLFPKRTNVGFVQVVGPDELRVRVWERGCCAAAPAATRQGMVGSKVVVHVLGGDLQVEIGETLFLSGAAEKVFEGRLF